MFNFVKFFSGMSYVGFDFHSVNVVNDLINFLLNHPCIPRSNHTWPWCIILLMSCWIQCASIWGEFLQEYSSGLWVCSFCFLQPLWFRYHCNIDLIKWAQNCFLPFNFLGRVWEGLLFKLLVEFFSEAI